MSLDYRQEERVFDGRNTAPAYAAGTIIRSNSPSPSERGISIAREFIEVGSVGELREGTMKKVMVRGHAILIARVKGQYYAVDARCPHLEGDLSEGTLRDTILTCPMHHSQFDLQDGHVIRWTDSDRYHAHHRFTTKAAKIPETVPGHG